MIQGFLGTKIGMMSYFLESGECVPVTVVHLGPNIVVQKKTIETDGYDAVQVGYGEIPKNKIKKKLTKPLRGHLKVTSKLKYLTEFKVSDIEKVKVNQVFDISEFEVGSLVAVSGISKGRGFSGVMKRHNFSGGPSGHGHKFHRSTGSIGASATPARVMKNKKMPGQYGNSRVTTKGLEIIAIIEESKHLVIKGAIPGANNGIVEIKKIKKNK